MKVLSKKDLKEIIQSGHLNLLIGSGCSQNYLSTLTDIETRMNIDAEKEKAQKDYYSLIRKSKAVLDESLETEAKEKLELNATRNNYDQFLGFWASTIANRFLHIVNKQVNIFTTNFDMFMEDSCERLGIPYNDGFSGQINPTFTVANFNRIQKYKSLQFDNTSDIPLFNIIKLHGSLSWEAKDREVIYSNGSHIANDLDTKNASDFSDGYDQIAVINPNAEKHFETVLDTNYASMLRKFTLELEKENSVLLLFGFSLADKHIRDLLYGVMKTNPTLVVIYFSFSHYDEIKDKHEEKQNANLYVVDAEINIDTFIQIFGEGSEDKWKHLVEDMGSDHIKLIKNINEAIESLPEATAEEKQQKESLKQALQFPFFKSNEYLLDIFTPSKNTEDKTQNESKQI